MATAGRKKTFTKIELFYIQEHCTKMSAEELAEEIGCNVQQVEELVAEFKKTSLPNAYEQMVRKNKQAIAMTGTASEIGDQQRKKGQPLGALINKDCIHKIGN